MEFRGKTAVVTGAGSGLGRGLALTLANEGTNVVLVGRHLHTLDDMAAPVRARGVAASSVVADVSKLADVERVADAALQAHGAVHFLFNNAGIGPFAMTGETTMADWEWVLGTNLWGVIHGVEVFLPLFQAQGDGHISATASESGLYGTPFLAAYNTSKFAVVGLMQSLARDLGVTQSGVSASVFCPGAVRTDILANSAPPMDAARAGLSEATQAFRSMVGGMVADGMDPEAAAACAVGAIKRGAFWAFSHDHVPATARKQAEVMAETQALLEL